MIIKWIKSLWFSEPKEVNIIDWSKVKTTKDLVNISKATLEIQMDQEYLEKNPDFKKKYCKVKK